MNRTRNMALSALMSLIMIGMILAPAAMAETPGDYTATVLSEQNTAISNTNTTFNDISAGSTNNISESFDLTNTGNGICNVDAQFTTSNGSIYGFNATDNAGNISGTNFYMNNTDGVTPAWVALKATAEDTDMGADQNVAADNVADTWSARLVVPAAQAAGTYTGVISITFSAPD